MTGLETYNEKTMKKTYILSKQNSITNLFEW